MAGNLEQSASLLASYSDQHIHTGEHYTEKDHLPRSNMDADLKTPTSAIGVNFEAPVFSLLKNAVVMFLYSFIPSFMRRSDGAGQKKLHPTAYLDGIRGVAAFFVFIHHFILDWFPFLSNGYGANESNTNFFQLPGVRIIYSGRGMVATFFVISGYVISYKALRLMRAGHYGALLDSLASSVFRRGMRLYIPTLVCTLINLMICRMGWYRSDVQHHNMVPSPEETFMLQLKHWWAITLDFINPFGDVGARHIFGNWYDGHLWTIPIEMRGSLVVFIVLVSLAKVRPAVRLLGLAGISLFALRMAHWDIFLFLSGTFLADLGFAFAARAARSPGTVSSQPDLIDHIWSCLPGFGITNYHIALAWSIGTKALAAIAVWLLCTPDEAMAESPGYGELFNYTPAAYVSIGMVDKFWLAIGAVLFIIAVSCSPTLQRPFTTGFAQYLGNISYALYMVHGPVLYTLGMQILLRALGAEGPEGREPYGPTAYAWAFTGCIFINTTLCFLFADWVWRIVDVRSVKFAKWVSDICWVQE
jgi:peptidoglycan/LPS O-acetylase OafA/YrhL